MKMDSSSISKLSILILCLFEDSPALDPCKQAYDACEKEWLDRGATGDQCDSALKWQDCIRLAADNGVCDGTEGHVAVLDQELETHCDESSVDACKEAQSQCKQQWTAAAKDSKADKCDLAKDWRTCMDDYIMQGRCQKIPSEVADEEKKSCTEAAPGSKCVNAMDMCRAQWEMKYADSHMNSLKCKLAQDWDSCVQLTIIMDCTKNYVPYPTELARQEAYCGTPDVVIDHCQQGKDLCKDAWSSRVENKALKAAERCDAVKSWQTCLLDDSLQQQCDTKIQLPDAVNNAELEFCVPQDSNDAQSCTAQETKCNKDFLFSDSTDKCDKSVQWRSCLEAAQKKGCGVVIPAALEDNLKLCLDKDACDTRMEACRTDFVGTDASQDRCSQARKWRACLENLVGFCAVSYPRALDTLQAQSCYIRKGSVNCLSLSTKCKKDYQDNVRVTGESCVHAEEWRKCLEDVSRKHSCQVVYPRELNVAQATLCYGRSNDAKSCSAEQVKCKEAFDGAAATTDKCQNARNWRKCLDALLGNCKVLFPFQLNKAEATHCYSKCTGCPNGDNDDRDAGGAPLSCQARMDRCRVNSLNSHGSDRCGQAKAWRSCLESLRSACQVTYPRELDQLQAVHCYVRPGQAKPKTPVKPQPPKPQPPKPQPPKPQPPKKTQTADDCATKGRNCKPANAKTCDDARKWRACLDTIRDECGMKVYVQDLNILQATTCYG